MSIYYIKRRVEGYLSLETHSALHQVLCDGPLDFLSRNLFERNQFKIVKYLGAVNRARVESVQAWIKKQDNSYGKLTDLCLCFVNDFKYLSGGVNVDHELREFIQVNTDGHSFYLMDGRVDLDRNLYQGTRNGPEFIGNNVYLCAVYNACVRRGIWNFYTNISSCGTSELFPTILYPVPAVKIFEAIKLANVLDRWRPCDHRHAFQWVPYSALFKNLSSQAYEELIDEIERYARCASVLKKMKKVRRARFLLIADIGTRYRAKISTERCFVFSLDLPAKWQEFEKCQCGLLIQRYSLGYLEFENRPKYSKNEIVMQLKGHSDVIRVPCRALTPREILMRSDLWHTFVEWTYSNHVASREFNSTSCFEYKLNRFDEYLFDWLQGHNFNCFLRTGYDLFR
jgi:hypothetical protein